MNKLLIIFVAIFLAVSSTSFRQARSLVDEAKEQLEQLKSIVQGHIFVAHDNLESLISEFQTNYLNVTKVGGTEIEKQYYLSIEKQFNHMVNLAHAAGYDVTSCTETPQQTLIYLRSFYKEQIDSCIQPIDGQAVTAARDARYVVDITMNKVHDLENQLNRCREDVLCVSPLITHIEVNKVRMPQNIQTEVQVTESLFTTMKISVKSCADYNVVSYATESNTILREIEACINEIIG